MKWNWSVRGIQYGTSTSRSGCSLFESENSLVQGDKQEEKLQTNEEAVCEEGSNKNDNDQETIDLENCVDLDEIPVLKNANTETDNDHKESDIQAFESLGQVDQLEIEQAIQENDPEPEKVITFHEERGVDQPDGDSATEPEDDGSGVDSDGTVSEADSNQAVQGSDIAEEEMILSELEGSVTAPTSPSHLLEEAKVKAAPVSPFAPESISAQFPRPNKSATTTSKNSAMKLVSVDNNNKENNMEMMVNVSDNGEIKAEAKKQKKKKVEFDEENLKDVSMRQLVKMVKELSIKSSNNRTTLQMLPGNNHIAE
ncbi:uncharacterized protein LOC108839380 [Raphanus sativus]|uniref:Uncharacterized protein LOC108839380 n=1 Tax=Raphanus sativus TaxID=3726 RepID=A0A6J0M5C2_RAPSA|nr:uncharacterized protein LOC108839380 [Raphanus sativus]